MNPKSLAAIGELLLEEAILAVFEEGQYLDNNTISERTGIYTSPAPARGPYEHIVNGMMDKLESKGKVNQYRAGNRKVWALSDQA